MEGRERTGSGSSKGGDGFIKSKARGPSRGGGVSNSRGAEALSWKKNAERDGRDSRDSRDARTGPSSNSSRGKPPSIPPSTISSAPKPPTPTSSLGKTVVGENSTPAIPKSTTVPVPVTTKGPSAWAQGPPPQIKAEAAASTTATSTSAVVSSGATLHTSNLDPETTEMMKARFTFVSLNLVGQMVQVRVSNGDVYEGIFHTLGKDGVALNVAKKIKGKGEDIDPNVTLALTSPIDITALNAEFREGGFSSSSNGDNFLTDSSISGLARADLYGRTLETVNSSWLSNKVSDDVEKGNGKSWDQFATNEKLFGVKNTFKEEMYTTKLDVKTLTKDQQAKAAKLEKEILSQTTNNKHIAEERGKAMNDDLDEEDRFGRVITSEKAHSSSNNSVSAPPPGFSNNSSQINSANFSEKKSTAIPGKAAWTNSNNNVITAPPVTISTSTTTSNSASQKKTSPKAKDVKKNEDRSKSEQKSERAKEIAELKHFSESKLSKLSPKKDGKSPKEDKGEEKTEETKKEEEEVKSLEVKTSPTKTEKVGSTSESPEKISTPSSTAPSSTAKPTLNPTAKEFNPNPAAKPFIPPGPPPMPQINMPMGFPYPAPVYTYPGNPPLVLGPEYFQPMIPYNYMPPNYAPHEWYPGPQIPPQNYPNYDSRESNRGYDGRDNSRSNFNKRPYNNNNYNRYENRGEHRPYVGSNQPPLAATPPLSSMIPPSPHSTPILSSLPPPSTSYLPNNISLSNASPSKMEKKETTSASPKKEEEGKKVPPPSTTVSSEENK